ncbi:hypothetical protein ScalyP_jg8942 [Parmales sp. scaly parma]|nr:hypothetical protein ScalyP_jg8942 [Parmales sp. scaly parma]
MLSVISMFQEAGDNRFARSLAQEIAKKKEEEEEEKAAAAEEEVANRRASQNAIAVPDPIPQKPAAEIEIEIDADDIKAEAEAQQAIADRAPSPVVFARTLTRLSVADNIPPILKQLAANFAAESCEGSPGSIKSPQSHAAPAPAPAPAPVLAPAPARETKEDSIRTVIKTRRPKNAKRGAAKTQFPAKGRKLTEKAPRYGCWYVKPSQWSVGMTDVLEEMEAKEKGSWGMEMALFNKRAKQISEEIPKLFIGKAFKQKCESEPGARVPHFLANVEQEEGGGLEADDS